MFKILTKDDALKTTAEVHARLKKSGAEMKDTTENWSLLGLHLKHKNLAMIPDNFIRAISQLSGSLEWEKAPKPKATKFVEQSNHGARVNHADPEAEKLNADPIGIKSLRKAYAEERDAQTAKASREALADCTSLIKCFIRNTHSKTYAGRTRLSERLQKLSAKYPSDGVKVFDELQKFEQTIP